jgi:hypothetical protein
MKNYYYILEGKAPKAVDDPTNWARWYETADRTVKKTKLPDCEVSTVFLGMNHAFGGEHDGHCARCATWEEAEKEHQKAIELVFEVK